MLLEFADDRSTQIWAIKKLIFSLINEMLIKTKILASDRPSTTKADQPSRTG